MCCYTNFYLNFHFFLTIHFPAGTLHLARAAFCHVPFERDPGNRHSKQMSGVPKKKMACRILLYKYA